MAEPTSPANLKRIDDMFEAVQRLVINVYDRWQDEKEYEDINDYKAIFDNFLVNHGMTITKVNKKPFGFNFTIGTDAVYNVFVNNKQCGWKRVS